MLGVCLSNEWQVCLSGSGGSLTLSKAWRCEGSGVVSGELFKYHHESEIKVRE